MTEVLELYVDCFSQSFELGVTVISTLQTRRWQDMVSQAGVPAVNLHFILHLLLKGKDGEVWAAQR